MTGLRVLTAAVAAAAAVLIGPGAPAAVTGSAPAVARYGGPVTRGEIVYRARDWLARGVPYTQDNRQARWDHNRGRRYRPDCSGFVSMAWKLDPRRPGLGRAPVTWELPRYSTRIAWAHLARGDIVLRLVPADRSREHVQLFERWLTPSRTAMVVLEHSGRRHGLRRAVVRTGVAQRWYAPYRYRHAVGR